MSLAQLQAATAFLVRFPDAGRGADWEEFANQYELAPEEKTQLHYVAHNHQVLKYGKKLRRFRFIDALEGLPAPESVLGTGLFETLWFEHFEPRAAGILTENLNHDFLKFLCEDAAARVLIARDAPPYARDFLFFIYQEVSLSHHKEMWRAKALPKGSLLTHAAICPLELDYDVPKVLRDSPEGDYRHLKLQKKRIYYVLVLKEDAESASLFAIDRSVHDFFKKQLTCPSEGDQRPVVYKDLVRAGLCQPIS